MAPKVFQFLYCCLVLLFTLIPQNDAQGSVNDFEEKFRLEKNIAERLEQVLKTRLDKAYFDVTVEATIKNSEHLNNHNKVVYKANGEKDILQTWMLKELGDNRNNLDVVSLKITLGLSDQVQAKYREDLRLWLKDWTTSIFGPIATSDILVRPTNIIEKASPSENLWSKLFTGIGAFQNLIGMLFLGGMFFVVYLKSRPSEVKNVTLTKKEIVALPLAEHIQEIPQILHQDKDLEFLKTLRSRVGLAGKTMGTQVEYLISRWATKEHENFLKIVAMLEALAESGAAMITFQSQTLPTLSQEAGASLSKAFIELHGMSSAKQIELLEDIYTELVAGNLIRIGAKHSAFEFLDHLDGPQLKEIFTQLTSPYQVSLLMKMSDNAKYKLSVAVEPDFMKKLLEASFQFVQVSDQELAQVLKDIGAITLGSEMLASDLVEQKIQRLRDVWAGFSRKEEALWMYQFVKRNPDMKKYFEHEKMHLAFLADWASEDLRRLSLKTKTTELAAAIKSLPHLNQAILSVCGDQMRNDIINCMAGLEEPRLSKHFENFTQSFDAYITNEMSVSTSNEMVSSRNVA